MSVEIVQNRHYGLYSGGKARRDRHRIEQRIQSHDGFHHHLLAIDIQVPIVVRLDQRLASISAGLVVDHVQPRHGNPLARLKLREIAATRVSAQQVAA